MAAGVPCALVTSCSATFTGDRLVQHILGTEDAVVEAASSEAVRFYPWTIDNKYYSAEVNLCVVPSKFLVTAEIAESVQAFVVYFDSTQKSGLDSVSSWLPLAEAWLPEVMILVCDRVCEDGVNRQKAQEWCIKHGFELVELSPEELPEEDDDFPESTGVKRIVQALNANVWSNVVMKNVHILFMGRRARKTSSHFPSVSLTEQRSMFLDLAQVEPRAVLSLSEPKSQGFSLLNSLAGANRSIGSAESCHSEQARLPAAERIESLQGHRGGACGSAGAQVDSIVGGQSLLDGHRRRPRRDRRPFFRRRALNPSCWVCLALMPALCTPSASLLNPVLLCQDRRHHAGRLAVWGSRRVCLCVMSAPASETSADRQGYWLRVRVAAELMLC
ncbi:alpha- and gamma-adaptin-binding protein p34 isoform X2 [Alexandromys fortis]|uniref:alpha- and gamma-adaptin-binding protein p34 isoform X2 n=1 Tax=Alexandromys fortis TaxID=100897 RepID=UPI0021539F3A|nr:alpha- and gamma-adaptin-binding protein p34 isoform X2 [Microtus fortis]